MRGGVACTVALNWTLTSGHDWLFILLKGKHAKRMKRVKRVNREKGLMVLNRGVIMNLGFQKEENKKEYEIKYKTKSLIDQVPIA